MPVSKGTTVIDYLSVRASLIIFIVYVKIPFRLVSKRYQSLEKFFPPYRIYQQENKVQNTRAISSWFMCTISRWTLLVFRELWTNTDVFRIMKLVEPTNFHIVDQAIDAFDVIRTRMGDVDDEPFFVCNVSDIVEKYRNWQKHMPRIIPFYGEWQ